MTVELSSPVFADGETIPERYVGDRAEAPPPLRWSGIPAGTAELTLEIIDPDADQGPFVHWLVAGIDPTVSGIEDAAQARVQGRNGLGVTGYACPRRRNSAPHRYVTTLYVLAEPSGFAPGGSHMEFIDAMRGKELSLARLVGYLGPI